MAIMQEIASRLAGLLALKETSEARTSLFLSLDDVLETESVDEPGVVKTRIEYHYSKLLIPRYFRREHISRVTHVGVDSSSRTLATPHAVIIIGSLAVSLGTVMESFTWPPLHGGSLEKGPPFMALMSYTSHEGPTLPSFVTSHALTGSRYTPGYGISQVSRELRIVMENWALENVEAIVGELTRRRSRDSLLTVMLDGPLFLAPEAGGLQAEQGRSWIELMKARIRAIEAVESSGIPVIGVVKRVESSTILSRTREFVERASRCIGHAESLADMALIHLLLKSNCDSNRRGNIMFTPKISVEYGQDWIPRKIVEYAVILPSTWHLYTTKARVLRVEVTQRSLEILRDHGLDPESVLAGDTVARGSVEPATILLSDKVAGAVSGAIKKSLIASLVREETPLTYDEARGVEKLWRAG